MQYGRVRKPTIGIQAVPLSRFNPQLIRALKLPVKEGLMVIRVDAGSAGDRAGLQNAQEVQIGRFIVPFGDVIVKVDGQAIAEQDDLDHILNTKNVGDRIQMEVVRDSRRMTVTVQLAERRGGSGRRV
jgi:serine protease Do/serine protease DegQ